MTATPGNLAARSRGLVRRLLHGRLRVVVVATVLAIWLLVAVLVGLGTAGGVVWF